MDIIMYILMDSSHYSLKPKCTSLKHFHEDDEHFYIFLYIFTIPVGGLSPTMTWTWHFETTFPQSVNIRKTCEV